MKEASTLSMISNICAFVTSSGEDVPEQERRKNTIIKRIKFLKYRSVFVETSKLQIPTNAHQCLLIPTNAYQYPPIPTNAY